MTDEDLEERLQAHYRAVDPGHAPGLLVASVDDALVRDTGRGPLASWTRRPLAAGLATLVIVIAGLAVLAIWTVGHPSTGIGPSGTGPVDTPSAPAAGASAAGSPAASPSQATSQPYRLAVLSSQGSPEPTITVASSADCKPMPTDWLRWFCMLTLRANWHSTLAPTDPFAPPPNAYSSVTFLAAEARAQIEGDTSFCSDFAMREFISVGSTGVTGRGPAPGSTFSPIRPIATCLTYMRTTAATGYVTEIDPGNQEGIRVFVDPGAVARAATGSAPAFDPFVGCQKSMARDLCSQLISAVIAFLGSRQSQVDQLVGFDQPVECLGASASCTPPSGGSWLGSVRGDTTGGGLLFFDVAEIGGQATVTEVAEPTP